MAVEEMRHTMKKYQGIIFDFDYTLGDSTEGIVLSVRYALGKMGYGSPDVEAIRKTIGLSLPNTFQALTGIHDEEKAGRFSTYFKEKADKVMVENTEIYPKAAETLKKLKRETRKVGIVTTKYRHRIENIFAKYEMLSFVDEIIGSDDVSVEKPDPEGLLLMLQKLQLNKEDVLYVGDSLVDAETAERASVDFAGVLTGTTGIPEFREHQHVMILADVGEIPDVLQI